VTKSRYYSTTLGELRGARAEWRADRDGVVDDAELENDTTPVLSVWEYVGCGYLNPGDVLLAAGVEASIRVAREALIDERRGPPPWVPPAGVPGRSVVTTHVRAALGARRSAAAVSNAGLMRTAPRVRSWRKSREMPPGC
jgi:hypothetical protein